MLKEFYQNKLYPLQDVVMKIMGELENPFYLTGGTALSRFFLHHRYSDDLDFFVNRDMNFKDHADIFIDKLSKDHKLSIDIRTNDFVRFDIVENDILLKIKLINDVAYHYGEFTHDKCRIDNVENILSNKISAISRDTPKDFADILFIALNYSFNWIEVFDAAKKKDAWVNEIEIANIIDGFNGKKILDLNWIISEEEIKQHLCKYKIIAKDILKGRDNTLFQ
jgi:predicted nucleotidyltransferase component of viral defense system